MTTATEVPADLLAFLDRVDTALDAMFTGDPGPYADLWAERDDVTLCGGWGTVEKGHADVVRTFAWVGSRFSDGTREREEPSVVVVDGDLAYTVGFERGVVRVDGGEPAPMVLRVTHGFRRLDGAWRLTHRHADFPPPDPRKATT
ncbi:YybH family protein [Actinomycetospora aeridis]|uniref:Nuclear transport factor 2 family protein n=1 Tax=Actinomycetospora aeridis TaxID=3129231 RepID=A0ABU8MXL1_9PSEU